MKSRLLALATTVLLFSIIRAERKVEQDRFNFAADDPSIQLVPEALGPYRSTRTWYHRLPSSFQVENGASYARPGGGEVVQLNFFRTQLGGHHGLACDLIRGQILLSEELRDVAVRDGRAVFDVALVRDDQFMRLVASTECSARGCTGRVLSSWSETFRTWREQFLESPYRWVPMSVTIRRPLGGGADVDLAAQLNQDFAALAPLLELGPARRLAGGPTSGSP